jgi:hypothetical protein
MRYQEIFEDMVPRTNYNYKTVMDLLKYFTVSTKYDKPEGNISGFDLVLQQSGKAVNFVLRDGSKAIAFLELEPNSFTVQYDGRMVEISTMETSIVGVSQYYKGQGLGNALFDAALEKYSAISSSEQVTARGLRTWLAWAEKHHGNVYILETNQDLEYTMVPFESEKQIRYAKNEELIVLNYKP